MMEISKEVEDLFERKLKISERHIDVIKKFYSSIKIYLNHSSSNTDLKGRTVQYLEQKFDKLIAFYSALGATLDEMVFAISVMPSLLNIADDLYAKYLLLGVIENENNTIRKNNFLNKTNDLRVGLKTLYSRYKLISYSGYRTYNWNNMVHCSEKEFAKIFVKGIYQKPYQLFERIEDVNEWLNKTEFDFDIECFKDLDVNKEFVEIYEKREFRK
ncbi:MAG: hypothetical protein ACI31M_04420 [Bacilli bacterium]